MKRRARREFTSEAVCMGQGGYISTADGMAISKVFTVNCPEISAGGGEW